MKTRERLYKQYTSAAVSKLKRQGTRGVLFTTAAVCLSVFTIIAVGCAMQNEDEKSGDLTGLKEGLASKPFFGETQCSGPHTGYFQNGSTIDLCFTGPGGAADQNLIMTAVNQTWAIATSLVFRWNGTCPSTIPSNWISIYVADENNGGDSASGPSNRLIYNCIGGDGHDLGAHWAYRSDIASYMSSGVGALHDAYLQQVAVHEFGHLFGFYHEHDRADIQGTGLCSFETTNGDVPNGYLTPYDAVSIFNYCAMYYGRPQGGDYHFTPWDALGAEIIYPRSFSHPIRALHSFNARSGLVVRSDDILISEWISRGAHSQVYLPTGVYWYTGSPSDPVQNTVYPFQYSASLLTKNKTTAVQGLHYDTMSRAHVDQSNVTASNSLHTAILMFSI
jgi:hypothetical protein